MTDTGKYKRMRTVLGSGVTGVTERCVASCDLRPRDSSTGIVSTDRDHLGELDREHWVFTLQANHSSDQLLAHV